MNLYNKINREELKQRIANDGIERKTVSFYRYVRIENPSEYRDDLYSRLDAIGCLGRIYVAQEGINAQMNVPSKHWGQFEELLKADEKLIGVPLKVAVEDDSKSFYKLKIKVRSKIVADGITDFDFDPSKSGNHLSAKEFNEAMEQGALVIDMRNHYESEVGHFQGAITPDADTFRDELKMVESFLKGKEDQKILMYCTGGIRCEKASAYFKHLGYKDVNQLRGGIIEYAHQVQEEGLDNKYIGKNFVFDERLGERISEDVIAECHTCGKPCDDHTNCKNEDCHVLFIQCTECKEKLEGCCSEECKEVIHLPEEEQRKLRKEHGKDKPKRNVYKKGRLRPKLSVNKA